MEPSSLVVDSKFLQPEYLASLRPRCGAGSGQEGDCCALQERRRWSGLDTETYEVPETDSRVCGKFLISFQDRIKDDDIRARLCVPLMVKLVGSAGSLALEEKRRWVAIDWAVRVAAPMWLDKSPELAIHAAALRALPPITDRASASAGYAVRDATRTAAWALREANLQSLREKVRTAVREKLAERPVAEVAVVEAVVEAVAVAVAAVAAAAVVEDLYGPKYWAFRAQIRDAVRESVRNALRETSIQVWESGAVCLTAMLDATE